MWWLTFFLLPAAGLILGIAALTLGLRGRRRGSDPHCRACDFSLKGLDNNPTNKCPECGAPLSLPRAVVRGTKSRLPLAIAAGVILLAVSLPFAARWRHISLTSLEGLKPNSALFDLLLQYPNDAPAGQELSRRIKARSVTGDDLRPFIAAIMAKRKQNTAEPALASWLEYARAKVKGAVPDAQWEEYARTITEPVAAEFTDAHTATITWRTGVVAPQGGYDARNGVFTHYLTLTEIKVNGQPFSSPTSARKNYAHFAFQDPFIAEVKLPLDSPTPIPRGSRVELKWTHHITDRLTGAKFTPFEESATFTTP